mmetsp:Transcript_16104/g.27384  ORF Transcript_16104/g.27384 Transcript_16104/m.27384 type:complete len:257 (+) Transcript_16104:1072-1842(+)
MVSRKKLKGQARKAKAKEKKRGPLFALLPKNSTSTSIAVCTHGWSPNEFPADHDCHKFVEAVLDVITNATVAGAACSDAIDATGIQYPEVWNDQNCLEWIHQALISIGTSILLSSEDDDREVFDCSTTMGLCEHIQQHLACIMYESQPFCYHARVHDLLNADQRRLVSYLKKRIPCSCLDEKYKAVKSLPKMGTCRYPKCSHPQAKVALSKLMTCERCRIQHYCSEKCQAADWQRHKENDNCKQWSKWRLSGGANQ